MTRRERGTSRHRRNPEEGPRVSFSARLIQAGIVAAFAVTAETGAAAEDAGPPTGAATIVVSFDPRAVEQERVIAAVKAHLSGLPVQVVVRQVVSSPTVGQSVARAGELARVTGALGTFSIEFADDGAFLVFFTEPGGSSTLIRRLPANEQGVRVTVEEAAIVVRSLVFALLDGRRIGMADPADAETSSETEGTAGSAKRTTARAARPAGPRSERTSSETTVRPAQVTGTRPADDTAGAASDNEPAGSEALNTVAFTGAYAGTDFATNMPWQSGFTIGARWVALPPLYAAARYTFFPALEHETNGMSLSITRHPGEIVVGYLGTTRLAANAEAGFVLDYTRRETQSGEPGLEPSPPSARWAVALGARAGASFAIAPVVQVAVRGGADFLLTRYDYVDPEALAVVSPRRVRPRLDLELAVSVW